MNDPLIFPEMWDLARIIEHMTAAAERQAGLTPAECLQRDLEQIAAFAEWHADLAGWESAAMDGLGRVPRWPGNGAPDSTVAVGSQCTPDHPSLRSPDDAFNFAPACRLLAAHFMPGAPGLSVDYFAQYLMDCVTDYLAIREEFRK